MADRAGGGLAPMDHQFYVRHKSVQSFYNEFYGLGDFNLIPITGELLGMEKMFGAKWRKTIRGGAKQMNRLKALMQAIANMAATEGGSVDRSIGIIELASQDNGAEGGKQCLSNLVDILKKQGLVASATSRGPRGRGVGIG
jgi:hypothetical protein